MKHSTRPDLPPEDWRQGGFGLYIHWPYCLSKCPYCDFNSHVVTRIDHERWAERYKAEIRSLGEETEGRILSSIYFGGGTPSLMQGATVHQVMTTIRETWRLANDCEITLEANPGAVDAARFAEYRDAGIERLSIGVQALNQNDLKRLGRMHSVDEALSAIELARSIFSRVNFDLIYARQGQGTADWRDELSRALEMDPDHLSLYQLTVEEGTVFAQRFALGQLKGLPDEALAVDMFELTQELCEDAGLHAYEVSNHAKRGSESRHNMIYWTGGDYGGIGPGAHGRLTLGGQRYATEATRDPKQWLLEAPRRTGGRTQLLSPTEQGIEYVMMGLRLETGISRSRLAAMDPEALSPSGLDEMIEMGMVQTEGDRLSATRKGRLLLNQVIGKLLNA